MVENEEEEARDEAAEVGGTPKLVKTAHKEGDGPKPAFDSGTAGSSPSINGGSVSAGRMGRIAARKAGKYIISSSSSPSSSPLFLRRRCSSSSARSCIYRRRRPTGVCA